MVGVYDAAWLDEADAAALDEADAVSLEEPYAGWLDELYGARLEDPEGGADVLGYGLSLTVVYSVNVVVDEDPYAALEPLWSAYCDDVTVAFGGE